MKRPSKVRKRARKAPSRKASKAKRVASRKVARGKPDPASRLRKQLTARTAELAEARAQLSASLQQQTATADVLKVISSSVADAQPVFEAILDSVNRLFDADSRIIFLTGDDGLMHVAAAQGQYADFVRATHPVPLAGTASEKSIRERRLVTYADVFNDPEVPPGLRQIAHRLGENYSMVVAPLLLEDRAIGTIFAGRVAMRAFSEKECALLRTFADQAVIAIQNARLFNETNEALERQMATADVLRIISQSPTDVQPVFEALVLTAVHLLKTDHVWFVRCDGATYSTVAIATPEGLLADTGPRNVPIDPEANFPSRVIVGKKNLHLPDWSAVELPEHQRRIQENWDAKAALYVPLLRDDECIGLFTFARKQVGPFSERDIALAESFRDQALIAIENARLFNETQEALEQQTATADILKVIASSPSDVQPVFQAIADRSNRLVNGLSTTVLTIDGDTVHLAAFTNTSAEADAALLASFPRRLSDMTFGRETTFEKAIISGRVFSVPDTEDEPTLRDLARLRGYRSMLFVPLVKDGTPIGMIGQTRTEPGSFPEPHIALLKTFADQAVIAISNVNLFSQVRQKTLALEEALEQQTATAEVLQAISRSTFDLNTILHTLIRTAAQLCNTGPATIFLRDGDVYRWAASQILEPSYLEHEKRSVIRAGRGTLVGRVALEKRVIHIVDALEDPEYEEKDALRLANLRTALCVPMLRDGEPIGVFCLAKDRVEPFSENEIRLISTFADQAVIAIQNVQLFEQVQQRTRELSQSLEELRAAQDRLVQTEKLASLGQLTAGIAHEIKNPLNFVNNFSALSAELVDEMDDVLADASLAANKREELDEIRALLKGNLEKIVQHGKRADSIVKNMLLHSRDGSGEQRSADVNALVDESLNLAYHGARAEKQGFNITLQRDFDPTAGVADIYPQEITRVFLNLISNGFYAAAKRAAETGNGFEPVLRAVTKNLGDAIEIRIRDNGTGIPAEVKDKIFNPFFTTKPAGEGTGLGLSMSHDIVVKQHGGTISVASQPGAFTEFIVTLPRRAPATDAAGGPKT